MMSTRKAAGSRRGNRRTWRPSDSRHEYWAPPIGHGTTPRHEERFANILDCWPLAPGQTPPAKRWPA